MTNVTVYQLAKHEKQHELRFLCWPLTPSVLTELTLCIRHHWPVQYMHIPVEGREYIFFKT